MENASSNYVELSFIGIDDDCFLQGVYEIESRFFKEIEFIKMHTAKFYFVDNLKCSATPDELVSECRDILLRLYIQLLKEESYFIGRFEIENDSIKIKDKYMSYMSLCEPANMLDSVCVFRNDNLRNL